MRLTDLDPHWYAYAGRHGQGIDFDCPHCPAGQRTKLAVAFANPLDGGPPEELRDFKFPDGTAGRTVYWYRTGETFDMLSLSPSVDAQSRGVGHWHGFITQGEVR